MRYLIFSLILFFFFAGQADAVTPVTPVEISHSTDAVWTDVDLTSNLGGDAGDVAGVILEAVDISGFEFENDFGVRKNGSTDTIQAGDHLEDAGHSWFFVGLDGGDIFELYLQDASDTEVYLVGYITNAEGSFFTNRIEKSLSTTGTWTDVDISADTGGDTAIVAFLILDDPAPASSRVYGFRENGSTDDRFQEHFNTGTVGAAISLDGSEIFEGYIGDTDMDWFLMGYLTSGFTSFANAKDYSTATTGSYVDADFSTDIPSGNTGAFVQMYNAGAIDTNDENHAIRKNGTAHDIYKMISMHQYAWVEIDSSRIAEQKIQTADDDLYLWGYTSLPNTAPTITSATDSPDPVVAGNNVTFSVDWNDADTEGIKMYICKADDGGTSGCGGGGTWCSNSNDFDSTDPITCTYTAQSGDAGSNNYYAHVCDDQPTCSSSSSGTFTVNNAPTITSVADSPDPIETGNTITFSVDWNDADTEGIKMLICKSDAITTAASPSCDGGEWSSNKDDFDSTDPITSTYTVQAGDVNGSKNYYAFVCDDGPECSSSTSSTFTVGAASSASLKFGGASAGVGAAAWYHPKWGYRKKITIQNANVDGDLTDFPLYVDITSDTDIGANAQADGDDIRFTTDDGITVLPHEEESFTVSAGSATGNFWVKIPTVTAASSTDIYVYYGNADAADGQQITDVWDSSYKMVQHMTGAAYTDLDDSTSNNTDVTAEGGDPAYDQTGKVNNAVTFDGTGDYVDVGDKELSNSDITVSVWFKANAFAVDGLMAMVAKYASGTDFAYYIVTYDDDSDGNHQIRGLVRDAGNTEMVFNANTDLVAGQWYHGAMTFDSAPGTITLYLNGINDGSLTNAAVDDIKNIAENLYIGSRNGGTERYFNGTIDEVRITNDVRTANEIKFEHANMNEADNELTWDNQALYSTPSFIRWKGGTNFK